jgi:hypothetical protein
MGSVRIDRLDHLVLTVADFDAAVEFYLIQVSTCLRRRPDTVITCRG